MSTRDRVWRTARQTMAGAAVVVALAVLALIAAAPYGAPASAQTSAQTTAEALSVEDAVLRWAVNNQTGARSHNPTAINFLAAGVADPGRGGVELPQGKWRAKVGNVEIQKRRAAGGWRTATWDGLGTDPTGAAIEVYGPFSGHRVSFTAGVGTVDPTTDSAHLQWEGTFTVLYYSGNSAFTLSDPTLEVTNGAGTLTAELGGWASGRDDPGVWEPVAAQRVVVADLPAVDLTDAGATVTPAYAQVQVAGTVEQVRTGEHWGSFPAPMVAALAPLGIDQFWYSTGLQSDWTKVAAPVLIGYAGQAPEDAEDAEEEGEDGADSPGDDDKSQGKPKPSNPVRTPPATTPAPTPVPSSAPVAATPMPSAAPTATEPAAGSSAADTASATLQAALAAGLSRPVQVDATRSVASADARPADATSASTAAAGWWVGGALLLAAAVLLLIPAPPRPGGPGRSSP